MPASEAFRLGFLTPNGLIRREITKEYFKASRSVADTDDPSRPFDHHQS
jgi:hypothetical protein